MRLATVLRYTAFTIMTLFGLLGGLFVAGYAFEDLDTWVAIGATAAWFVPTVALSVFALLRPDAAAPMLLGVAVVVGLMTVLDAAFHFVDIDAAGPVVAIGVFATAVALGFLGLHRSGFAGLLLVFLAVAQFGATVLGHSGAFDEGGGPRLSDLLTTSSGVVVPPMFVVGLLYLTAGAIAHEPPGLHHVGPRTHAAH